MNKLLEATITQAQATMNQAKEWQKTYEEQAKTLTENKTLLDQFYKQIKNYEYLQFYLAGVNPTQDNIFTIQARYLGQPIATIEITKDHTTISTYDEINKSTYNCDIQLKNQEWNTKETMQFLNFFDKEIKPKTKIKEQEHIQAMLLGEFAKTTSYNKQLIGIRPITYSNLFYPIPIILNPNEEPGYIDILTRTKVRKLTIVEPMNEKQTPEMVLANATSKAIFLLNLLHTEQGQQYYKIFGFHGRLTQHTTIKVCLAIPKQLKSKSKEFEPFELKVDTDSIEYHYMTYDTDGTQITSINTTLNE